MPSIKDLKTELERNQARWLPTTRLLDSQEIPTFRTGGLKDKLLKPEQVPAIDFPKLFAQRRDNPFVLERRIALKLIPENFLTKELRIGSLPHLEAGEGDTTEGPHPASLDWRNRFGWPWITSIRDQNGCEACWCFAAVALIEAMVRIEHCVWPNISEGDVHKGMGHHCCDCGNPGDPLDWMKAHAAADPGCFPWPLTASGCTGCGGTGGGPYDGIAYTPTADRSGRSVRIPGYTNIGSVADQKTWLDTVGPIVTWFDVWKDFQGYGSGVYHKQATLGGGVPNTEAGGHFMLVIGYDNSQNCWIVKNSWGTGWGQNGFGRIGYGETGIDSGAKIGIQGVNPDPWTKRRLHSGAMMESGNGALHRNFEMLTTAPSGQMRHWWRDNSASGLPWHAGILQGNDVAACPTLTGTTFNRNFESVHLTTSHRLHHWWFDQTGGNWHDGGVFGPTDASGVPGFIQANYGAPGNFEVVVATADGKLNHWWRDGSWHDGGRFGGNVGFSGPSLLQSHYGTKGNFELVCVLKTGQMQHFWRDNDHGDVWHAGAIFGSGIGSSPCMIEGSYGAANENAVGNFELCVAAGGKVQHWWRANSGDGLWRKSATFGHDIRAVATLVEGSFGFNLEVVVLRNDNKLQHYWRDGGGWHEGVVIGSA
ncbi:MAG TPA: C1 family peptidase [Bradyrhizobium sp.]|nr:C1 family peptidase [Bradyrhizobium sp.]